MQGLVSYEDEKKTFFFWNCTASIVSVITKLRLTELYSSKRREVYKLIRSPNSIKYVIYIIESKTLNLVDIGFLISLCTLYCFIIFYGTLTLHDVTRIFMKRRFSLEDTKNVFIIKLFWKWSFLN